MCGCFFCCLSCATVVCVECGDVAECCRLSARILSSSGGAVKPNLLKSGVVTVTAAQAGHLSHSRVDASSPSLA